MNNSNAALLQSILTNNIQQLYKDYTFEEFKIFFEKMETDGFGKSGKYDFFCKHCGGIWYFEDKKDKIMFERLHKNTGCVYDYEVYNKVKKGKNPREISGAVKKRSANKGELSPLGKQFIEYIKNDRIVNDQGENTQTNVSGESKD